jgi:hypothetical protein
MRATQLLISTVALIAAISSAAPAEIISTWRGCTSRNLPPIRIVITCGTRSHGQPLGGNIMVTNRAGRVKWQQSRLNPWKLQVADVDGDGEREIVVGVWKKSPYDRIMAKRVFVYGWNGRRLFPKWLGSRLSRRFIDFAVSELDRDGLCELLALEMGKFSKHRVSVYRWRSFGFDWVGTSKETNGLARFHFGTGASRSNVRVSGSAGKFTVTLAGEVVNLSQIKGG